MLALPSYIQKPNICFVFTLNIDLRVLPQKERSELLRAFTVWKLRHCDEKREVSRLTSHFHYELELFELCMCCFEFLLLFKVDNQVFVNRNTFLIDVHDFKTESVQITSFVGVASSGFCFQACQETL